MAKSPTLAGWLVHVVGVRLRSPFDARQDGAI
jgi:hypothetical protein